MCTYELLGGFMHIYQCLKYKYKCSGIILFKPINIKDLSTLIWMFLKFLPTIETFVKWDTQHPQPPDIHDSTQINLSWRHKSPCWLLSIKLVQINKNCSLQGWHFDPSSTFSEQTCRSVNSLGRSWIITGVIHWVNYSAVCSPAWPFYWRSY